MDSRYIDGLDCLPQSLRDCVLTIGNFDGVHLGHQRILRTARALADEQGTVVVALTFEPPPDLVLHPEDTPQRITPHDRKVALLLAGGADYVVAAKTDRTLLEMSAAAFIQQVIARRFAPRCLVEGRNFHFGRARAGTIETLTQAGPGCGFAVQTVEPVTVALPAGPARVSSTLIRELLLAGKIDHANCSLGYEFTLYERVIAGQGRGRLLDFTTVNVNPGQQVVPADGVYAGKAALAESRFPAAISIGTKPTLGPAQRAVEAFLIDASGDFYERQLALSFVRRLRDQRRFDTVDQLKAQIAKDVERVREICG